MVFLASGLCCSAQAPKGKLTYCSYSCTGAAGLGKDYCELIADPGKTPKVVVVLDFGNRFGNPVINAEYAVGQDVVDSMQAMLESAKVYELNGYSVEEHMAGGHTYRIYQEYDSGEKINARWYGHNIKQEAWSAYHMIANFFKPWVSQARADNDLPVLFELEAKRVAGRGTDHFVLIAEGDYRPCVIYDINLNCNYKTEAHGQFNVESDEDMQKVKQLQQDIVKLQAIKLGNYTKDDALEGGTVYTVELKYASGTKQTMYWHSHDADPVAEAVYDRIRAFFDPWLAKDER